MKKKVFFTIFGLSLLISLLIAPLRGGYVSIGSISGIKLSSIVGFIIYGVLTYYSLVKAREKLSAIAILVAILVGLNALTLWIRIIHFEGTLASDLECLIHISAIFFGYMFYRSTLYLKILTAVVGIVCCSWSSTKGYNMWLSKLNFGTFTGKVDNNSIHNFQLQTSASDTLFLSNFKGQYLLLECWYTYCGVCYKKMPEVQKLYDTYKSDNRIAIYSLHCRLKEKKETPATGAEILKKEGYTYPNLSIDIKDPILKTLGVDVYPTMLVFDMENKLIFRGNVENASSYVNKLFSNKI
jgi:thiol-disulfide isomerase/thioredoxin